jgi:hypothetical protein
LKSEIDIVKQLASGPSDAEIRRRLLIESDPDVLNEKVERLNQITLDAICGKKFSAEEQKRQLRGCRDFLNQQLRDSDSEELVQSSLEKQMGRVFNLDDMERYPFDPMAFLISETLSEDGDGAVVSLSDSDEEIEIVPNKETKTPLLSAEDKEILERKRRFELAQCRPQSSRTALYASLREKVQQTAFENYCAQVRVKKEQLQTRLQIAEKCRLLVELLKARHESRLEAVRAERRRRYRSTAEEEDEEFDGENDFHGGAHLLGAEELEVAEEEDGGSEGTEEDEEGEEGPDEVLMEELQEAEEAILDSAQNLVRMQRAVANRVEEEDDLNGPPPPPPEEEEAVITYGRRGRQLVRRQHNEEEEEEKEVEEREEEEEKEEEEKEEEEKEASVVEPSTEEPVEEPHHEGESESRVEEPPEEVAKEKEEKRKKVSGNAIFRMELEREEQLLRKQKVNAASRVGSGQEAYRSA